MIILRWFLSRNVREAVNLKRHVRKLLRHQQDILTPPAVEGLQAALADFGRALQVPMPAKELRAEMTTLERAANKWLKPYPHAGWRENVEMLLVALAVALAIRTFWLQPFKIPTGSMQPTLYGVTSMPDFHRPVTLGGNDRRDFAIPSRLQRLREWFSGVSYLSLKAKSSGVYNGSTRPMRLLIFNIRQTFFIGGRAHTVWFPPDGGGATLGQRAGLEDMYGRSLGRYFNAGEEVMRLRVVSGDHLFVNRVQYNFQRPERGEIVVFETTGIQGLQQDQFYIKRLVGLGGEQIRIGNDRHLIINETNRLDAATPRFEFVYSFNPARPPADSQYSGHVNGDVGAAHGHSKQLAPLFPDENAVLTVPKGNLIVMGDNTMNSLDGRTWGTFDERKVIGNATFVYWPISKRFGWGFR
ncbi:MAG: signal peptidase I [Verrucomicrobia bacterium]|jgi:signal peptidase I|nr:signal peptidase I [Verrucomicrobiota bacterium]